MNDFDRQVAEDREILRRVWLELRKPAADLGVDLKWYENKGTISFIPMLPAKEDDPMG